MRLLFSFTFLLISFVCLCVLTSCTQPAVFNHSTHDKYTVMATDSKHSKDHQTSHEALARLIKVLPPDKSIAFVGVENLQGEKTELSRKIFYSLEPQLLKICKERNIKLVERDGLKAVMDEWLLEMSGFTGEDKGARELLGADIVLVGKVGVDSDRVNIYIKALSLEDGLLLGSETVYQEVDQYGGVKAARMDNGNEIPEPKKKVSHRGKSDDNKLRIWTEKKAYLIGEKLVVYFEVEEPSYVTIVDITPDGEKNTIFPNLYMENNYCVPGVTYQLPPPNAPFVMEVTGPAGRDRIIAITGDEPKFDTSVVKTRGIKFTEKIVNNSISRVGIAIDID